MDEEEYKMLREGLIALLCVGDKLNRIRPVNGYNHKDKTHFTYYMITRCTIIDFENEDVIRISDYHNTGNPSRIEYKSKIDEYNGQLYIWDTQLTDYYDRRKELTKRIEADETRYEWF
jgi:hypothetical protein